jgi:hypothetical protein
VIRVPADQVFRAVDVAAPVSLVFRWLCQLRVAPYSYDWVDNHGRRSPAHLVHGLDQLAVGQQFMSIFRLVAFDDRRSITLASTTRTFGRVAVTYRVDARSTNRSRIVVKAIFTPPDRPHGALLRWLLPPGDLIMMRRQLVRLRSLAERDAYAVVH